MDTHDHAALQHYLNLIAQRYPPELAAALAAQRYQVSLLLAQGPPLSLPALRDVVQTAKDTYPALARDAGRLVVAIEKAGTGGQR
jgi:hypothetical protein